MKRLLWLLLVGAAFAQGPTSAKDFYGDGPPLSGTATVLGSRYIDLRAQQLYVCTAVTPTAAPNACTWSNVTSGATPAFSALTPGTNANALHIGTGGSLDATGSGTIASTSLLGGTWAIPGSIGATTPNVGKFHLLGGMPFCDAGYGDNSTITAFNACDTQLGASNPGIMWIAASMSTFDPYQDSTSTWTENHLAMDLRQQQFSGLPGGIKSPLELAMLKTTSLGGVETWSTTATELFHQIGGTNTNGGPKTTYAAHQFWNIGSGIGQDFAITGGTWKFGQGDSVYLFGNARCEGNFNEGGGEGCETIRTGTQQFGQASLPVATVSTYVAGTGVLTYTGASNNYAWGIGRYVIDTAAAKIYTTGTLVSAAGTPPTITGSGTGWATQFGSGAHTNLCFSHVQADLASTKWVIPISSITDDTHLILNYAVNNTNTSYPFVNGAAGVTNGDGYRIYFCNQITTFPTPFNNTITFSTATGYQSFAAADTIEEPTGYQFTETMLRMQSNVLMPSAPNVPSSFIRLVEAAGSRPVSSAIWVSNGTQLATVLRLDNALQADSRGEAAIVNDTSVDAATVIRLNDSTTARKLLDQNAANAVHDSINLDPTTNLFCFGTTATLSGVCINHFTQQMTRYNNQATAGIGMLATQGVRAVQLGLATNQAQTIYTTTASGSGSAGLYMACVSVWTINAGSGTTTTLNLVYNNGAAITQTLGNLNLASTATPFNGCFPIYSAASQNIQITTTAGTYGTSTYGLAASVHEITP